MTFISESHREIEHSPYPSPEAIFVAQKRVLARERSKRMHVDCYRLPKIGYGLGVPTKIPQDAKRQFSDAAKLLIPFAEGWVSG
jgi:hypothetical protein